MNVSDEGGHEDRQDPLAGMRGLQVAPRRPDSWLSEAEIRARARRRSVIYLAVAAVCAVLFVVLIVLLMERTRWSAGSSEDEAALREAHREAPAAR